MCVPHDPRSYAGLRVEASQGLPSCRMAGHIQSLQKQTHKKCVLKTDVLGPGCKVTQMRRTSVQCNSRSHDITICRNRYLVPLGARKVKAARSDITFQCRHWSRKMQSPTNVLSNVLRFACKIFSPCADMFSTKNSVSMWMS